MENPILPWGQAQEDHGYHLGTMFTESVIEAEFKIWSESSMTGGFGFYFLVLFVYVHLFLIVLIAKNGLLVIELDVSSKDL